MLKNASETLCASFLQNVRSSISTECYQTWFKDLSIEGVEGTIVRIAAPNRYVKQWLESHYKWELAHAISIMMPDVREVQIIVRPPTRALTDAAHTISKVLSATLPTQQASEQSRDANHNSNGAAHAAPRHASLSASTGPQQAGQLSRNWLNFSTFSPHLRLEAFIVGKGNRVAHAAAESVAESPAVVYNPLLIHGAQGLGKSHLLQGIGQLLSERKPALNVLHCSCEEFTNAYVSAVQAKRTDEFRQRFRGVDALLVDDIQFLVGREKTQEEFLHTFDSLRNSGKQIVVSASCPPREIKRLDTRLATRLQSGLLVKLEAPDLNMRMDVLREKAKVRGLHLPPAVVEILAAQVDGSIRELEGVICKVVALAAAEGKAPDRELAIVAMRELGYLRSGPLTLQDILVAICQHYTVGADEIRSNKRHAGLVHARHVGMYLSKQLTAQGVAEIGRFYGNRDHATVLHAARKIAELLKRDDPLKQEVHMLRQVLGR